MKTFFFVLFGIPSVIPLSCLVFELLFLCLCMYFSFVLNCFNDVYVLGGKFMVLKWDLIIHGVIC